MTREQVIKGLECCYLKASCAKCPYDEYGRCVTSVTADAIALIREQQEQLKTQEWRRFEFKELTEEEKAEHPEWCYVIENTPDEGEILASDGKYVWKDEFCNNGVECYLDSGHEMERCWWMPLPELPKEGD